MFASHGKGTMAKYRKKIENKRIWKKTNLLGRFVRKLLETGVMKRDPNFYYLQSGELVSQLGTSWQQLRNYESSDKLIEFLESIDLKLSRSR